MRQQAQMSSTPLSSGSDHLRSHCSSRAFMNLRLRYMGEDPETARSVTLFFLNLRCSMIFKSRSTTLIISRCCSRSREESWNLWNRNPLDTELIHLLKWVQMFPLEVFLLQSSIHYSLVVYEKPPFWSRDAGDAVDQRNCCAASSVTALT